MNITHITVSDTRRALGDLTELKKSIQELGLLNPITVTPSNRLIAGYHRLAACRELGWVEIPAVVIDLSDLKTELAEIDENLVRNELTVLQRSQQLARRKDIYEALYPQTKAGVSQAIGMHKALGHVDEIISPTLPGLTEVLPEPKPEVPTFAEDTATKTGVTQRTVQQEVQIAKSILPDVQEKLQNTKIADNKTALLQISRLEPQEQRRIVNEAHPEVVLQRAKELTLQRAAENRKKNEELRRQAQQLKPPTGKFQTIVIDPPWDMEKIARLADGKSIQTGFDYPTMSADELKAFDVATLADKDCFLFAWTTQKHLPLCLALLETWGFKYTLTMVWHKSGGFQPFGLPQYNCEFVVLARKGNPQFVDTKNFFTCFNAPRREHSRKPDEFYTLIERVCPGPRVDVFSREKREGFAQYGNETNKFTKEAATCNS